MTIIAFFELQPVFFIVTCTVLGLVVGSFLNVVIYRLPIMLDNSWRGEAKAILELEDEPTEKNEEKKKAVFNLVLPNSHCPHCDHAIRAWENIPVISYLFLGGKCADCKTPIPFRYPLVELFTGILSGIAAWHFGVTPLTLAALALTWCLVPLTMIDFDHQLLPDDITLPLVWAGLMINSNGLFTSLHSAIWGAVLGYGSLWCVFWLFKLLTGKEGMGYGDFKLLAALGAWFGWQALPIIILLSSLVGATVGLSLVLFLGRDRQIPIPFGPYLAAAGWITMLWGDSITEQYFRLTGMS